MKSGNKATQIIKKNLPLASEKQTGSILTLAGILIVAILAYSPVFYNDFITNSDDYVYLIGNNYIRNISWEGIKTIFSSIYSSNYHPLTTLSNALEYKFFGLSPRPYHFINLFFHLLNTLLTFRFILLLSGKQTTAMVTAFFFALHPVHVESVAWAAEHKDVLYSFFYLSALITYLHYVKKDDSYKYLIASGGLFVLSLLSKSSAVTLPVLFLLIDIFQKRKFTIKIISEKIPFFILSLVFGLLALYSQRSSIDIPPAFPWYEQIVLVLYGIMFYILKLFIPTGLAVFHLYPAKEGGMFPVQYYLSVVLLGLVVFGLYKLMRNKPEQFRRDLIFGCLFFLISISLVLQIIPVGKAIVSERYTYIPYIGLFFCIGQLYACFRENPTRHAKNIRLYFLVSFCVLGLISVINTYRRCGEWKDDITLYSAMIDEYPAQSESYYYRGYSLYLRENFKEAISDFDQAIQLNHSYSNVWSKRADAKSGLMDYTGAIKDYNEAIRLDSVNSEAYHNRACVQAFMKNYQGAMTDYNKSILLNPSYDESFFNRAMVRVEMADSSGALNDFTKAIEINPDKAKPYLYRGLLKLKLNDTTGACEDWNKAKNTGNKEAFELLRKYCQ